MKLFQLVITERMITVMSAGRRERQQHAPEEAEARAAVDRRRVLELDRDARA